MESAFITLGIIAIVINIALIWSIFNIRQNIQAQMTTSITTVRLLAKIAINTGSDPNDVNKTLSELERKL